MRTLNQEIERIRGLRGRAHVSEERDFRGAVKSSLQRVVRRVARRRRGVSAGERYLLSRLDGSTAAGDSRSSLGRRVSHVAGNVADRLVTELLDEFDRNDETVVGCSQGSTVVAG